MLFFKYIAINDIIYNVIRPVFNDLALNITQSNNLTDKCWLDKTETSSQFADTIYVTLKEAM